MAGGALIRALRETDATAVAGLQVAVNPHYVVTPELVWYRASREIEGERRRDWVAELDGRIVGCAQAGLEWYLPGPPKGRFWVGVHPERRGCGVGGELYATARRYLVGEGVVRLRTWVDGDLAGERFVRDRGFRPGSVDRVSALDPREVEVSALPGLEARGFRLAPLTEVRHRVEDLFAICAAGERDMPSEEPEIELDLESWRRDEFDLPDLSTEGSFVALARGRPVSLAFLRVDRDRRIAYNQMTATLPEYRRRGLALMVKLAAVRWASGAGIERLLTENDAENVGMLAMNERLGYRPLYEQRSWSLELVRERPPGERR
jgi:GNAT superfamily N-acetyltransferase